MSCQDCAFAFAPSLAPIPAALAIALLLLAVGFLLPWQCFASKLNLLLILPC